MLMQLGMLSSVELRVDRRQVCLKLNPLAISALESPASYTAAPALVTLAVAASSHSAAAVKRCGRAADDRVLKHGRRVAYSRKGSKPAWLAQDLSLSFVCVWPLAAGRMNFSHKFCATAMSSQDVGIVSDW